MRFQVLPIKFRRNFLGFLWTFFYDFTFVYETIANTFIIQKIIWSKVEITSIQIMFHNVFIRLKINQLQTLYPCFSSSSWRVEYILSSSPCVQPSTAILIFNRFIYLYIFIWNHHVHIFTITLKTLLLNFISVEKQFKLVVTFEAKSWVKILFHKKKFLSFH